MTKNYGFTLAEVLITLGIIGVVAAMTMPTLINQTNGAQYKAAYKKALSAISQGVTLNVALDDISFADTEVGTAGKTTAPTTGTKTSVASLLQSRMNIVKAAGVTDSGYGSTGEGDNVVTSFPAKITVKRYKNCKVDLVNSKCPAGQENFEDTEVSPDTFLFFNDSSMLAFSNADTYSCTQTSNATGGNRTCVGVIDVNGVKGPNKVVTCDGATTGDSCEVKSPTDIYPVEFYDQTILPASPAAKAVLYGK